jgi:hypothetical protein
MLSMLMILQAIFTPGTPVEVQTAKGWEPGKVVAVSRAGGKLEYKVSHKTGNFTFEDYFAPEKVRAGAGGADADGPVFALDQMVDAMDWRDAWRGGTVIAVEGSPGAWRYKVKYADGSDSTVYEAKVRAGTGAAPAARAPDAGGALALGAYACTRWMGPGQTQPPVGSITLLAGGNYRWLSNGGGGRYSYDPATGGLRFLTGPVAEKLPKKVTYQRNRTTSQIDLNFGYGVDWSCGHNL